MKTVLAVLVSRVTFCHVRRSTLRQRIYLLLLGDASKLVRIKQPGIPKFDLYERMGEILLRCTAYDEQESISYYDVGSLSQRSFHRRESQRYLSLSGGLHNQV